jgi:hypothetical protein
MDWDDILEWVATGVGLLGIGVMALELRRIRLLLQELLRRK